MSVPVSIPLAAIPSQSVATQLGNQSCTINVYQKETGLFLDLVVSGVPIVLGRICLNAVFLVQADYLGFAGDLCFGDTMGTDDPHYSGLGTRFQLMWVAP